LILIVLRVRFNVSAVGVTVYSISVIVGAILIEDKSGQRSNSGKVKSEVCGMKK
jgi:hypothetical protein